MRLLRFMFTIAASRVWFLPYLIVAPLALHHYLGEVDRSFYRVDETGWTRASIRVAGLLGELDLRPRYWQGESDLAYGSINPALGKIFFALPILFGVVPVSEYLPPGRVYYDLKLSLDENKARGAVMPPQILNPLRRVSAVLGTALCLVCMGMIHRARGAFCALIAGVALAWNPLVANLSSSVVTDVGYQLFMFASGLAGMALITVRSVRSRMYSAGIAGLLLGIATAFKYSAPFLVLPFLWIVLLVLRAKNRLSRVQMYQAAAFSGFSVLAVVVLTNPMLWPDVPQVSLEGLRKDYRLLQFGELTLNAGEAEPEWVPRLHAQFAGESKVDGGRLLQLTPYSLEVLRDYLLNVMLATSEPQNDALHPENMVPDLFALLRPAQLPLIYFRWVYFAEWVKQNPEWLHASPQRFLRNVRYKFLSYSWEYALAPVGCILLLVAAGGRHSGLLSPGRTLLLFAILYMAVLYATRISELDRYVLGMVILRSMMAAIGLEFMIRSAGIILRRAFARRGVYRV